MSEETVVCPAGTAQTFSNRRDIPGQWPHLIEQTARILGEQPQDEAAAPTLEQVEALHEVVAGLDNEELDESRFYAIGGTLCYFARRVSEPQTYAGIVDSAARNLFQEALIFDELETGLAVGRIGHFGRYNHPFYGVSRDAVEDLPPADRFLAETLATAEIMRRHSGTKAVEDCIGKQAKGSHNLAESIALNALAGAAFVVRHAIAVRGDGKDLDNYDKAIGELIDPAELAALGRRLYKVAIGCAQLRTDEMQLLTLRTGFPVETAIRVNEQREPEFNRDYLSIPPRPAVGVNDYPKTLHEQRLECPALQVGMIPLMMRLTTDIVIRTDQLITADYAR